MWKYIEPKSNDNVRDWDIREYNEQVKRIGFRLQILIGDRLIQAREDAAGWVFAYGLNKHTGILLCTGFSLFKACTILGMTVSQQSLIQIMMFIQDGLDELKNMAPADPEDKREIGEAVYRVDGKTFYAPVELTATDVARDAMANGSENIS